MIKAVLSSKARPYSVNRRMESVRSTLEDWMGLEIGRNELPDNEFFDVYYHDLNGSDPLWETAKTCDGAMTIIEDLRQKLTAAYPDCAPLRKQLHRLDMSLKFIGNMKSKYGLQ